jgi:hypothetical protein
MSERGVRVFAFDSELLRIVSIIWTEQLINSPFEIVVTVETSGCEIFERADFEKFVDVAIIDAIALVVNSLADVNHDLDVVAQLLDVDDFVVFVLVRPDIERLRLKLRIQNT